MLDAFLLSNLLLLVPILYFCHQFLWGDRRKALTLLSAYLFLSGIVILTKFVLKVPRPARVETEFDPYSFPSYHTAFASLLFFIVPSVFTLIYGLAMGYLRAAAGVHTWVDVLGGFIFAGISWWLYRKGKERVGFEWDRQCFHMGSGALLGLLLYKSWQLGLVLLIIALAVGWWFYHMRKHPWVAAFLDFFDRDGTGKGAFTFVVGVIVATALNTAYGWIATFYLGYVDSVATMVGKYFRTRRKSWYGTVAGLLVGFLVAIATETPFWFAPIISLVEYFSPIDDNFAIPIIVSVLGWFT